MTDYQERYESERRRADICEGQIIELRRQIVALEQQARDLDGDVRYWKERVAKLVDDNNALKKERRELRKQIQATTKGATP